MSIDSKLWSVRSYNSAYAHVTQRATGQVRTVPLGMLPGYVELANMSEQQFNRVMRCAFHSCND